jgi:hypothetical protein
MALALPLILLASALAFQVSAQDTPSTPIRPKGVSGELAGDTKEDGVMSFGKYEGGSLAAKPTKVTLYVNESNVVVIEGKQRFAIPVKAIVEVVDGNTAHARVGTVTGATIANSSPKNNQTVVGIVWKDGDKKNGVVVRLDKGDYDGFVSALQTVMKNQ